MKHRLKRFYKELKLLTKLRLLSIFVTVLLLLMLFVITFIFNRNFSRQQMSQYSKNSFDYAAKDLDMTIHDVIRCFTYLCGTEEFKATFSTIKNEEVNRDTARYILQDDLQKLTRAHSYINQAILIDKNHFVYSLYSSALSNNSENLINPNELNECKGIQILPSRRLDSNVEELFPLVIPLYLDNYYVKIDETGNQVDLYLVLFLNSKKLSLSMHNNQSHAVQFNYYLYSKSKNLIIPLKYDASNPHIVDLQENNDSLYTFLHTLSSNSIDKQYVRTGNYIYTAQSIPILDVYLLMIVKEKSFISVLSDMKVVLLIFSIISLVLISTASYFSTRYVSRPILKLLKVVESIESGTYDKKLHFKTDDEIGQLMRAMVLSQEIGEAKLVLMNLSKVNSLTSCNSISSSISSKYLAS
ncbi:MAG: HAMP domain-containing protein [Fermentimonas sp.]